MDLREGCRIIIDIILGGLDLNFYRIKTKIFC